jgi:RsiW-degrading membrane proteinase PrsW (M82 family)
MESDQNIKPGIIARELELEGLHHFSLKTFLSETFRSCTWAEIEEHLSVGTRQTTPPLSGEMSYFPKPWLFVRILAATLLAYFVFLLALNNYQETAIMAIPALIFCGCFAVPFAVLTLFFEMNTPCNVSSFQVIKVLVMGGAISFLMTFILFDYFPLEIIYGASSAGILEELAKVCTVVFLARNFIGTRHTYVLNGLLYGAAVGTGFAAFESAGYSLVAGLETNSFASLNHNIWLRGFLSPFMHITWTAIASAAYWLSFKQCKSFLKAFCKVRFLSLFVISILLHFTWNFDIGDNAFLNVLKFVAIGITSWTICFMLVATGFKEIRELSKANSPDDTAKESA